MLSRCIISIVLSVKLCVEVDELPVTFGLSSQETVFLDNYVAHCRSMLL